MTISTENSSISYTGDGSTVAFSFPYLFYADADLEVYDAGTLKTITTHYTVTGAGVQAGGTVTFVTAPTNGNKVVIKRVVDYVQETDLQNFDGNPADVTEKQFDLVVMQAQQLNEVAGRALLVPVGTSLTANEISGTIDGTTRLLTITSAGPAASSVGTITDSVDVVLTGEASGDLLQYDGSNWINKDAGEIINALTSVTAATTDELVISDASDGNNPKKITVQGILDLAGVTSYVVNNQTTVTLALTDHIGIGDASDSNANKKALVSDIFALISSLTEDTTPAKGDYLVTNDVSDSNNDKYITIENLYKSINDLTQDSTPASGADYVVTYDTSASAAKKVLIDDILGAGLVAATQAQQESGSSTSVFTSPGRQQYHPSAAKFWADVSHSSTTPTLTTSYNVTSITDNGNGDLTVTIATDFSGSNYCVVANVEGTDPTADALATSREPACAVINTKAAGSVRIKFYVNGSGGSNPWDACDPSAGWQVVGYGDQ